MPRPLRPQFANATYHVTARGNRRSALFVQDDDRKTFLHLLRRITARKLWICHAYCLMTTHYHLLLTTREANIASGMQWLNSMHASLFNDVYGHTGHVFQGRYHTALIETASHLVTAFRYIAVNPCRAGVCSHPKEWPWSSYGAVTPAYAPPVNVSLVAEHFAPGPDGVRELRRFVEGMAV